jgi:RHS repeat-associated protein
MHAAAKEETLAPRTAAWSDEEIFSLAVLSSAAPETRIGANAQRGEKTHQGIFSENGSTRVSMMWVKCSGTHQLSEWSRPETVLGPTIYGYDGHGSVRQLTNASGAVTDSYDYDAFGNLINSTGSTPNNYLFAGEQFDPALGLYYNRARYYNNTTGRFWSMDTYEGDRQSPLSLHKYLYVCGNPVNGLDPSGHDDIEEFSIANAVNQVVQSMSTLVTTAARITFVRLLTVAAALGSTVFSQPGLQEQLEEGGSSAIAAVQNAFFEYQGVVSEAEAEESSIWTSYSALRQYLNQLFTRLPGANPPGIEYHHIVEQSEEAASGFAENAINSMSNVIPTPSGVHAEISAFYSTAPEWLEGLTVREWMATQTWETQWSAGLEIWKQAMTGAITWQPPI